MLVEVKKVDKLKRVMKITVEGADYQQDKTQVYNEAGKNLKVPGFRPGTAPIDVLEKHHAPVLKEEFIKKALSKYYQKALEQEKINPAGYPNISGIEFKDSGVSFSAEFEIKPQLEITEKDFKGIKIKESPVDVSEEEIKKVINNLRDGIKKIVNREVEDQEIARWAGYSDIAGLTAAVKSELSVEKMRARKRNFESQIIQALLKNITIDLPESVIDRHHQEMIHKEIENLNHRGVSEPDIEKYRPDLEKRLKPIAQDEVKLFYILDAVANKAGLKTGENLDVVLGYLLSVAQY